MQFLQVHSASLFVGSELSIMCSQTAGGQAVVVPVAVFSLADCVSPFSGTSVMPPPFSSPNYTLLVAATATCCEIRSYGGGRKSQPWGIHNCGVPSNVELVCVPLRSLCLRWRWTHASALSLQTDAACGFNLSLSFPFGLLAGILKNMRNIAPLQFPRLRVY